MLYFSISVGLPCRASERHFYIFFVSQCDSVKPQALFYYKCFCCILFPLFGGRWRLVFTLLRLGYIFLSADIFTMHMVNIFMFRLNFAHWPKELYTHHHHKACFTHEAAVSLPPQKNETPKLCDMCLIMNASKCPPLALALSLFLMFNTQTHSPTGKTIYNECTFFYPR